MCVCTCTCTRTYRYAWTKQLAFVRDTVNTAALPPAILRNVRLTPLLRSFARQVEELFVLFVEKLEEVKHPQTRTGTLRCVRALAAHHFSAVISFLLNQQMPYNASVQRLNHALSYKYSSSRVAATVLQQG